MKKITDRNTFSYANYQNRGTIDMTQLTDSELRELKKVVEEEMRFRRKIDELGRVVE